MSGEQSHVTNRLAQFIAGSQWEAIPPEVRREGVRGLLNFVGCALGGAQDEAMGIAVKVLIISASSCRTRSGSRGSSMQAASHSAILSRFSTVDSNRMPASEVSRPPSKPTCTGLPATADKPGKPLVPSAMPGANSVASV